MNAQGPAFPKLRQFLRADRAPQSAAEQSIAACDLCSLPLRTQHRHLLEMSSRDVKCACEGCALRFENVVGGRFKLIPRDPRGLKDFQMSEHQWSALAVPIDLAFILYDSVAERRTALYPSPAGVTESLLPLAAWDDLAAANSALTEIRPDVEALLINRLGNEPRCFVAPIDKCYELAGLIRLHWRGFSGGTEVWTQVERFFDTMQKSVRHA